ncbi:MAG: TRL-like family protein [Leptospira sp.]|nr:TRL-like family protein [Leptospira sp.]
MRKNKMVEKFLLALLFSGIVTVQCSSTGFGPQGAIFTSTKIGVHGISNSGAKTGSACTFSILGLVALGDGSVNAAASSGGIMKVNSIDLEGFSILGLFSKQCTVIRGD